ncbi:2Fe-2S iron-sulfur cluster-binding protein [Vibrio echinoideorum]|uniref:2Fe-2S iron-sulfur cluster-binding protein n=1 Tax=Vibrio echinoideorum TaxID=2100116 RepID=UPI00354D5988
MNIKKIHLKNRDVILHHIDGETIMTSLINNEISIPKACGVGCCGVCKVKKNSGIIKMNDKGGITNEEIKEGYILACCSYPMSNITLDF